jgi:peptidyl-prolyl cis-trans isomerase SurA
MLTNNVRALLIPALLFLCGWQVAMAQSEVIDRIVAVVGKEPILLSDLNAQAEFYSFNNHVDPATPGLKQQVLEALINEKLMLASALEDSTITVTEDEVTTQLDQLVAQRVQQAGSEKKVEELYGMPIAKMKREFRDETRKRLLVQYLQQAKFGSIKSSRREVEEFYAMFKDSLPPVPEGADLYHIFKLPIVGEPAKRVVRARASLVLDSIKAGGDFADFARRYSQDPATASSGGDLGSWRRGQFVKEFEEVVFGLKENQLSDIVETSRGFHIIQLLERKGESVHARHILFKIGIDSAAADSTIAYLNRLKDSIAHGADFSEMAKRHSDDKESGPLGGALGNLPVSQFDKSLQDLVRNMKEGGISDPVPVSSGATSGYQIVYLKKHTQEHTMNLQDDWTQVEQLAGSYKQNLAYQKWIKGLRQQYYWEVRL